MIQKKSYDDNSSFIRNSLGHDFTKQIDGEFADEIQKDADNKDIYVHYHDSICLYGSTNNQLVDVEQAYNDA